MTLETFAPQLSPFIGSSEKPEMKVLKADFGDGYTQASPDGLNSIRRVVSLKWDYLTIAQAIQMRAFFDAKAGATAFLYTIPGESAPVQWTCEEYDLGYPTATYRSINAVFRQSFNLV